MKADLIDNLRKKYKIWESYVVEDNVFLISKYDVWLNESVVNNELLDILLTGDFNTIYYTSLILPYVVTSTDSNSVLLTSGCFSILYSISLNMLMIDLGSVSVSSYAEILTNINKLSYEEKLRLYSILLNLEQAYLNQGLISKENIIEWILNDMFNILNEYNSILKVRCAGVYSYMNPVVLYIKLLFY